MIKIPMIVATKVNAAIHPMPVRYQGLARNSACLRSKILRSTSCNSQEPMLKWFRYFSSVSKSASLIFRRRSGSCRMSTPSSNLISERSRSETRSPRPRTEERIQDTSKCARDRRWLVGCCVARFRRRLRAKRPQSVAKPISVPLPRA